MVLDEPAPPVLAGISVLGVLSFADIDVELAADFVDIFESGALEVGTESAPLTNHAAMRLTGEQAGSLPYDDDGTKPGAGQALSLRVFGGRLDLHGKAPSPGWTRAQTTFAAGTTELDLSDEVDWPAGATIVVASTDFDPGQTEERAIVANDTVSGSGTGTLRVAALDHMHFGGEAGPYGGMTVQMHAEVAVLERNVKVYSDPSGLDERSGQIRIMSTAGNPGGGDPPVARLEGVEVTGLGQRNTMGIYPVHFHRAGDVGATGSYVRDCSIHHNKFRALTVHATSNLVVERTVAYRTWGHAFYLEDGVETGCSFAQNVALNVAAIGAGPIVVTDGAPGGFYLTHPANALVDNVAAASDGHGFYYAPPAVPPADALPANDEFDGNVAHSNRMKGFFLDFQWQPASPPEFRAFTAYKNGHNGMWLRVRSRARLTGMRMADNRAGLYLASGGWQDPDDSRIEVGASLIVGESANVGEHDDTDDFEIGLGRSLPDHHPQLDPPATIVGVEVYDGHIFVHDTTFAQFQDHVENGVTRHAAAFSQVQKFSPWAVDPRNRVAALDFVMANRVWFRRNLAEMGSINAMIVDQDGTLTTGAPGAVVIANDDFLHPQGLPATFLDPVTGADWDAHVIPARPYAQFQLTNLDQSSGPIPQFELVERNGAVARTVHAPALDPGRFATNMLVGRSPVTGNPRHYEVEYPPALAPAAWPASLRLRLRSGPAGQRIIVSLPLATAPAAGEVLVDGFVATQVMSPQALTPANWLYRGTTLTLMLQINGGPEPPPLDNRETVVRIR